MNPSLKEYIHRYIDLTEEELNLFNSYLKAKSLKKKEYLLQEGQICKSRYFILNGCLRLFYIDNKGNEQIMHFGIDNWWITDYESIVNQVPSKLYIQSTENTEVLELNNSSFDELRSKIPKVDQLFRKIMEKTFIAAHRRIEYMFSLSGEELYHHFTSQNPKFAQRVPQYMIASMLGLSPEFISKIRGKKK